MSVTPSSPDYIIPKLKAETIASLVKRGTRLDGRGLHDIRQVEIIPNYLPKADGSALVKLGNTQVLVGVKLEVGTPYPDAPDQGVIIVSAEFVPMASPVFEPGPPDENAIELARVIDRSIRELGAIDLSKLVLIPGKKVWVVWVDIYVLDHDGNLVDASSIATLAALLTAKIPKAVISEEDEQIVVDKTTHVAQLPLLKKVVTVTVGKLGKALIVDPDLEEESVLDTKIIFAISEDGRIAGIQKSGPSSITKDEVLRATDIAIKKGQELIKIVEQAVEAAVKQAEAKEEKRAEEGKEEKEEALEAKESAVEEVTEGAGVEETSETLEAAEEKEESKEKEVTEEREAEEPVKELKEKEGAGEEQAKKEAAPAAQEEEGGQPTAEEQGGRKEEAEEGGVEEEPEKEQEEEAGEEAEAEEAVGEKGSSKEKKVSDEENLNSTQ